MAHSHNENGNGEETPEIDPIPKLAQDLTNSEVELGFALWVIPSLQGFDPLLAGITGDPSVRPVVAVILSSYEVIVKVYYLVANGVRRRYSHREFGYWFTFQKRRQAGWHKIGEPISDAATYLRGLKAGIIKPEKQPRAIFRRARFEYSRP